jgi:hypothetical protein
VTGLEPARGAVELPSPRFPAGDSAAAARELGMLLGSIDGLDRLTSVNE